MFIKSKNIPNIILKVISKINFLFIGFLKGAKMKKFSMLVATKYTLLVLTLYCLTFKLYQKSKKKVQPHIIYILADDLGKTIYL